MIRDAYEQEENGSESQHSPRVGHSTTEAAMNSAVPVSPYGRTGGSPTARSNFLQLQQRQQASGANGPLGYIANGPIGYMDTAEDMRGKKKGRGADSDNENNLPLELQTARTNLYEMGDTEALHGRETRLTNNHHTRGMANVEVTESPRREKDLL